MQFEEQLESTELDVLTAEEGTENPVAQFDGEESQEEEEAEEESEEDIEETEEVEGEEEAEEENEG